MATNYTSMQNPIGPHLAFSCHGFKSLLIKSFRTYHVFSYYVKINNHNHKKDACSIMYSTSIKMIDLSESETDYAYICLIL